ncbi:MAG: phosphoadenylyl-sulfate reductase [Myxococcota bacterium]
MTAALKRETPDFRQTVASVADWAATATPEQILGWALERFAPRMSVSCSFGNPEGLVLIDMLHRIAPAGGFRVYTLDTGRLPQATYDLIDRVRDRYAVEIEVVFPDAEAVQAMVREHGMNLFYESLEKRQLCCRLRKVEPSRRYLAEIDAHVTGLRRQQSVTRAEVARVELEGGGKRVKVNPLVDWTSADVWAYVRKNGVPVNRLHAEGFSSVGCAPCTRAVRAGEDVRAGRWWWEQADTKECGMHTQVEEGGSGI